MKLFLKSTLTPIIILSVLVSLEACHSKKKIQKAAPDTTASTPPPPPPAPAPVQTPPPPPPAPPAPNYNFTNIQFEFDSSILRTDSYPILDKAAVEMKKDTTASFMLNGYASIEGTPQHNQVLSQDRANAVKAYLVNTGIPASKLIAKGNGTSNPIADNSTDAGRILNRRVEIKKQ
jgi:OOP family OmpA-OmpF porin